MLRRRQCHRTPVLLPGKSHGWRNLEGCSSWGCEELDKTERLHFHFSLSCIGEGNGNPLQCSCLENPRDGGAWGAAIYGVAQSRTRLQWLSSRDAGVSDKWRVSATTMGFLFWVMKIDCGWWLHNSVNILKTMELYMLHGQLLWYVN